MNTDDIKRFDVSACSNLRSSNVDSEIVEAFRLCMGALQADVLAIKTVDDWNSEVGAARWWAIHYGILLFGTCDAAKTLVMHNLARESWIHQRHAFELFVRAIYFAQNQNCALNEIRSEPIRQFRFAELSGIKSGPQFKSLKTKADETVALFPELASFELPPFEQMLAVDPKARESLYGKHYRMPSSLVHGTVLSFRETISRAEAGGIDASFDSSRAAWNLNELFGTLTNYLIGFNTLLAELFEYELSDNVRKAQKSNNDADARLNGANGPPG